jgi:hypothetical protein
VGRGRLGAAFQLEIRDAITTQTRTVVRSLLVAFIAFVGLTFGVG